jgi:bifunctional ADP-heptose synthase (sugar kinase/adenylyltransferase)
LPSAPLLPGTVPLDPAEVLSWLDRLRGCRVLCVGEAIIDEYAYCDVLGKSSKEPILAVNERRRDVFAGGILAVARHLAALGARPSVLTAVGTEGRYQRVIDEALEGAQHIDLVTLSTAPTIVKRRYIDAYFSQKLFEVYEMEDKLPPEDEAAIVSRLEAALADHDVVLCIDFGHGLVTRGVAELLSAKAAFLAVNAQVNAGNRGFNTITKFPAMTHVSLTESELRLELRDRERPLEALVEELHARLGFRRASITRGAAGCLFWEPDAAPVTLPALSDHVVDRIGAGDAFLSAVAPLTALGAPSSVTALIGSAVAAEAVGIVGNQTAVDPDDVRRRVRATLGAPT